MIVKREEMENMQDCHKYAYEFKEDEFLVKFYQAGNRDLYFYCLSIQYLKEIEIKINKSDYLLYNCFDKLYNEITYEILQKYQESPAIKENYQKLLVNNEILWESDDVTSEDELNKGNKIYNYLIISKQEDKYILKFVNNSNERRFLISFNTDRSKYGSFVYPFMELIRNLKIATEPNHQITLYEHLNELKLDRRTK